MCPQKENAKFVNFIKASVVFALGFCCGLGLTNLACFLWHLDRCGGGEEGWSCCTKAKDTHSGGQPAVGKKMGGSLQEDFSMKIHFFIFSFLV